MQTSNWGKVALELSQKLSQLPEHPQNASSWLRPQARENREQRTEKKKKRLMPSKEVWEKYYPGV